MLFSYRAIKLQSKNYRLYEFLEPSSQLRALSTNNKMSYILGNATAFKQLQALLLIAASFKSENTLFLWPDASEAEEAFQEWYPGAQFHQNLLFFNFERTQVDSGTVKKILKARKYVKSEKVTLQIPSYTYDQIKHWNLSGTLTVKNLGNWLTVACNYEGYLYMSREAFDFTDMPDDPLESFAHSHLFALTNGDDRLDFKYYYEQALEKEKGRNNII